MGNGKLAVVLPTYRFDETAKHCIRTVASMGGDDVDVFIGDNSENPEKWDFLHRLAAQSRNCHIFCHEKNIGGANWPFLLAKTDHEFIGPASDDDFFTPDYYFAGRDILRARPDCSAANGLWVAFSHKDQGMDVSVPRMFPENSPVDRLAAYNYWGNSLCFSVYRSSVMKRLDAYFKSRPFWPSYMDQFIAYNLLCAGKYIIESKRQLFVYNNHHWGTPERAHAADARWFVASGLPAGFIHLNRVCWAADIIHFFNSTYRPAHLSDSESDAITESLFNRMFVQDFGMHLKANPDAIGALFRDVPQHVQTLIQIVHTPWRDVSRFLDLFVTILRAFNEDVADRYAEFVESSRRSPTKTGDLALVESVDPRRVELSLV